MTSAPKVGLPRRRDFILVLPRQSYSATVMSGSSQSFSLARLVVHVQVRPRLFTREEIETVTAFSEDRRPHVVIVAYRAVCPAAAVAAERPVSAAAEGRRLHTVVRHRPCAGQHFVSQIVVDVAYRSAKTPPPPRL